MTFNDDFNPPQPHSNVEIVVSNVASSEANAEEGIGNVTELPFDNDAEVHSSNQATSKSDNDKSSKILIGAAALLLVCGTAFGAVALKSSNDLVSNLSSAAAPAPADSKSSKAPKSTNVPGSKGGKGLPTNPTIVGRFSTDAASSCAVAAQDDIANDRFAACSRYWLGGGGQDSTCGGTAAYLTNPAGNTPGNGNPGDNTCLGMGVSPLCIDLEGIDEPVPVLVSAAWEWSEYDPPSTYNSGTCGYSTSTGNAPTFPSDGTSISLLPGNPCGRILTNSSIPLVSPRPTIFPLPNEPDPTTGTTGQCYKIESNVISGTVPAITEITSTVTITFKGTDYVCNIVEGGQLCEMWGFRNGYANNFDSQYIPFVCDDIAGDAYKGYISNVFDHNQLYNIEDGIGQAPQFALTKL